MSTTLEVAKELRIEKEWQLIKECCKSFGAPNSLHEEYLLAMKIKKRVILVEKYEIPKLPPVKIPPIHHDNENHEVVAAVVKSYCDEQGIDWVPEVTTKFGPDLTVNGIAVEVGLTPPERITSRLQEWWEELWVFPYGGEYEKELSGCYYVFKRGRNWDRFTRWELKWRREAIEEWGRDLDRI